MLPKPIYEIAPFIYCGVGVTSLLRAENALGFASSALLVSAALLIFSLRHKYRSGFPRGY